MIKIQKLLILLTLLVPCSICVGDEKSDIRTPEFTIKVPKDHLFLVAIDRGESGNRIFVDHLESHQSPGVDPVAGKMMRLPAEVSVSLAYPQKRENAKTTPSWTVYACYKYSERETESVTAGGEFKSEVDWAWTIGYNFTVATKVRRIVYQHEGHVYNDYEKQITETPVEPVLEEVDTGVEGTKLYQIPFGEVDGVTRYIVVLVSDSFDSACNVLVCSDENPKFEWSTAWFHEQPAPK